MNELVSGLLLFILASLVHLEVTVAGIKKDVKYLRNNFKGSLEKEKE